MCGKAGCVTCYTVPRPVLNLSVSQDQLGQHSETIPKQNKTKENKTKQPLGETKGYRELLQVGQVVVI